MLIYYVHVPKKSSLEKSAKTGTYVKMARKETLKALKRNGRVGEVKLAIKNWLSDKVIQYPDGKRIFLLGSEGATALNPNKKPRVKLLIC
jgi:hypothetical protein